MFSKIFSKNKRQKLNAYQWLVDEFFKLNKEVLEAENRLKQLEVVVIEEIMDAVILDLAAKRAMRSALLIQIRNYNPTKEEMLKVYNDNFAKCIEVYNG